MFTQYFGNYLLEANIISVKQFREALLQMKDNRAKLGVLAIEAGYMTPAQVEETVSTQMQVDKKFGEIALTKGYITDTQLENLLSRQSSPFAVFSQIMIDNGYMSYSELSGHLENYKINCGMSAEGFLKFQTGDISPVIDKFIPNQTGDPQKDVIVRSYVELFVRNTMRFVSDNVTIEEADKTPFKQGDWIACQQMDGTRQIITSFSGSEDAFRFFACKFTKTNYVDYNLVRDIIGEFLNCTNGIFTTNALELGVDLDLRPQYVTSDSKSAQAGDIFSILVTVDSNKYRLSLAFR